MNDFLRHVSYLDNPDLVRRCRHRESGRPLTPEEKRLLTLEQEMFDHDHDYLLY